MLEECSSTSRCGVDPCLLVLDEEVVNSMLDVRDRSELISAVTCFMSVVLDANTSSIESNVGVVVVVSAFISVDANDVDLKGADVD